jgi:hypothetical protein
VTANPDRLFELLPRIIRVKDAEQHYPLRDLLRVIGEQVDRAENEIHRMYDNLFIETCDPWVVPYIGDLVGFRPLLGQTEAADSCDDHADGRFVVPRRLVADTLALRRRKGTLSVLNDLVTAVTCWVATVEEVEHATEVRAHIWRLKSWSLTRIRPVYVPRRTNCFTFSVLGNDAQVFVRAEDGIPTPVGIAVLATDKERIYGPNKSLCLFENGHPIATERIEAHDLATWSPELFGTTVAIDPERGRVMFPERYRLRRVTATYHHGFAAAIGGGEYPRDAGGDTIGASLFRAGHLIDGGAALQASLAGGSPFAAYLRDLLDPALLETTDADDGMRERRLCAELNRIMQAHNLSEGPIDAAIDLDVETIDLMNLAPQGPRRIRLNRLLLEAMLPDAINRAFARVCVGANDKRTQIIMSAVHDLQSHEHPPIHLVVELTDSGLYVEPLVVDVPPGHTFELRAADGCRPTIVLAEQSADIDDMVITCGRGSRVILDGLMVSRHAIRIVGNPIEVAVRHCTLVPGWEVDEDCAPCCGEEPSLILTDIPVYENSDALSQDQCVPEWLVATRLLVDRSIIGTIIVQRDEVDAEPARLDVCRSIVDATRVDDFAIAAPNFRFAHIVLSVVASTVVGRVRAHAIELGENSLFVGVVEAARRQIGCLRYSYVTTDSRTPHRHACQPTDETPVEPTFMDPELRYGRPNYCRLADDCSVQIREGADDESEMGVYHELHIPQRTADLLLSLQDYVPLGWLLTHSFET